MYCSSTLYDRGGAVRAAATHPRTHLSHPGRPEPGARFGLNVIDRRLSEHRMCGTGELSTHKRYRKESFEHHTGYRVTVLTPDSRGRSPPCGRSVPIRPHLSFLGCGGLGRGVISIRARAVRPGATLCGRRGRLCRADARALTAIRREEPTKLGLHGTAEGLGLG